MQTLLFIFIAILAILAYQFFVKSNKADKQTLLPLGLWAESLQRTPDPKIRNKMCLAITYQALKILELQNIYSPKEFSNDYAPLGFEFSYNNFIQNLLDLAPLELTQLDEAHQMEARAFFSYLISTIIQEKGKKGLREIILSSKAPHKDWY